MRNWKPLTIALFASALSLGLAGPADAFVHVVQKGETIAGIAEHIYGRLQYEGIIVYANALDACGGVSIAPGMRLEIPAVTHRRVVAGETWQGLAKELLGDEKRAEVLAQANNAKAWSPPEDGAEIAVPYNLRFVVKQNDTVPSVASRFFADKQSAWMLDRYNDVNGHQLHRGDLILVPLTDLPLTDQGKLEATASEAATMKEGSGAAREAQRKVNAELPSLYGELRNGHYLDAAVRGNRLLALGDLSRPQQAEIHKALVEAFVALDATGMATAACDAWRKADPALNLDPIQTSPKILSACGVAVPKPSASASAPKSNSPAPKNTSDAAK